MSVIRIDENTKIDSEKTGRLIGKHTRGFYNIDKNMVLDDIKRFEGLMDATSNRTYKKAYRDAVDYLKRFEGQVRNGYIPASWSVKEGRLVSTPIQIEGMEWVGLNPIDYILKRDELTVVIDYKDLWNAIAISIAHRDLGFSTKYIDNELTKMKTSLNSVESYGVIEGITTANAYNDAMILRAEDTQYKIYTKFGRLKYTNYFGDIVNSDRYKDMINSSVDKAMVVIVTQLLDSIGKECSVELMGVVGGKIYVNTDMSGGELKRLTGKRVIVRSLGRLFEINPRVEVY